MKQIIAIDPGEKKSAFVVWDGSLVSAKAIRPNEELLLDLALYPHDTDLMLAMEQIRSMGMPVGQTVFDTVFWSGRFCQVWQARQADPNKEAFIQIPRMAVKMHLCHSSRAKDSNIIRAIKDRFGEIGTVKQPNLIYGEDGTKEGKMKADLWQAMALAVYYFDTQQEV